MTDATYIITYRAEDESRRANLEALLSWLRRLPGLEILIVEQARVPTLSDVTWPDRCAYLFAFNPGPFNKAWGFNLGFKHSSGQVIALGDADVMVEAAALNESFQLCGTDFEAVKPYDRLIDLTPEETQPVLRGEFPAQLDRSGPLPDRADRGEYLCFCGGLFVIRRAVYDLAGGFDEKFVGWGGEDDAMTIKLHALSQHTHALSGHTAYHLWHEQHPQRRFGQPFYRQNLARLQRYQQLDPAALRRLCAEQRRSMGDIRKYEFAV